MESRFKWIWPAIIDTASAEYVAKHGFWAALYCAGSTIVLVTLNTFGAQLGNFDMNALADAFLFAIIGFGIWKMSRTASVAGLALYIIERSYAWATSGLKNPVVAAIFTLLFIHSVRGTFSYHKFKKQNLSVNPTTS
jgi:hypothetical protein